jgi:hypothetical protein
MVSIEQYRRATEYMKLQKVQIYIIDEARRQVVPATPAEILAGFEGDLRGAYTNLFLQRVSD